MRGCAGGTLLEENPRGSPGSPRPPPKTFEKEIFLFTSVGVTFSIFHYKTVKHKNAVRKNDFSHGVFVKLICGIENQADFQLHTPLFKLHTKEISNISETYKEGTPPK